MASVIQAADYFVVGGPVPPGSACYVERAADRALEVALAARRYCCVLGARGVGKTSLLLRMARRLRAAGHHVALIDLGVLAARSTEIDEESWYFAIAQAIVQELRVPVDLPGWWRRRGTTPPRRLADLFSEMLLPFSSGPVTVFIDEIERALELPFAAPLFTIIESFHDLRRSDDDYARLALVLAGTATFRQLWVDPERAKAMGVAPIALEDFTQAEAYRLGVGLGGPALQTQVLMDRVYSWTGGHPYLTQKVARGVERKGGHLEDVERVVHEQLLHPPVGAEDPLLLAIRTDLLQPVRRRAEWLRVLKGLAAGRRVRAIPQPAVREKLLLTGVVGQSADGTLHFRNRVFKELYGVRLAGAASGSRWKLVTAAAVLGLAALGSAALWYVQYFPAPHYATLEDPRQPLETHAAAREALLRWPGFAARTDALWRRALHEHSRSATTYEAAAAVDDLLRELPGEADAADALWSEFWARRTVAAMHEERRDVALLLARRALATAPRGSAAEARANALFAELANGDYPYLQRTLDLPVPAGEWQVDWASGTLTALDSGGGLQRAVFGAQASPDAPLPAQLTALRYRPLEREVRVEAEGSAGEFTLEVAIGHPAPEELLLTLTAPSGAEVSFPWSDESELAATGGSPLALLADEDRRGVWKLRIVDRALGNEGAFAGWGLRFETEEASRRDFPDETLTIPEPERTAQIDVRLSTNGRMAITVPVAGSSAGSIGVWNLEQGRMQAELPVPASVRTVQLDRAGARLLAATADAVWLWSTADGALLARLGTQTEFVLPPIFSADGEYFVIAERIDDSPPLYSLLRAENGELLTSIEGVAGAERWLLGARARYLAVQTATRVLRILDPRSGEERAVLEHAAPIARFEPLGPDAILSIDERGEIRVWRLPAEGGHPVESSIIGTVSDEASFSLSADGTRIAYAERGAVTMRETSTGALLADVRVDAGSVRTSLSPSGAELLTLTGTTLRVWRFDDLLLGGTGAATVTALATSSAGNDVAVGFRDGALEVRDGTSLDAALAESTLRYVGHRGPVTAVAFDATGAIVATGGDDGTARVWDVATGVPREARLRHGGPIDALALSADGGTLVSAAARAVRLWNTEDGALVQELPTSGAVTAIAVAADGSRIAVAEETGRVSLVAPGGAARLVDLETPVTALALSADATRLAVGDVGGGVRLLDATGLEDARASLTLREPLRWLAFAHDTVLLAATDHWLHRIDVDAGAALAVSATRFLPFASAEKLAIASIDSRNVRVAGRAVTGLRALEIRLDVPPAARIDRGVIARDWDRALGVALTESGAPATLR